MPAFGDEVQMALDEGVKLQELVAPERIEKDGGRFLVTLRQMKIAGEEAAGVASSPTATKRAVSPWNGCSRQPGPRPRGVVQPARGRQGNLGLHALRPLDP
jgi:hypothetical protein